MGEHARKIDISGVKVAFVRNFPSHPLSKILLSEPDSVTGEELLAKAQTWLAFFHGEKENE
ncbi:hypothetical protein [Cuniculiplasma divulgatum]|jgi:hypothetical protein|uniref:Uncharacterized protein n=1 Tax=Cuniculiplasma divulgatum TaxID=1673428 RepID=A0A1N5WDU5_9ARCH|nr:hypothetical protein [Cuniculiplasma divulgatum]WMT43711.1 MAG: hypothetical protein RE469_05780 [Cuniculiplasma divulgatum]SIM83431.1 hypothetical protein CSP5_1781 [Cuniculiplasma divulgatum]